MLPYLLEARRVVLALLFVSLLLLVPTEANAQQNYPGEYSLVAFNVSAKTEIVTASNCFPYARGCLGIIEPPVVVSYLNDQSFVYDVSLNRGYSIFFPFTPCLLRLPYATIDREIEELEVFLTSWEDSPLSSLAALSLIQLFPAALPTSPACSISEVNWEEFLAPDDSLRFPNPLSFYIRLGKTITSLPGTPTAVYGYSRYLGGKRFHEGFDTSWHNDPTANIIVNPLPSAPFIVRGGWFMNITPCELESNMFGVRDESVQSFLSAMERLERGQSPEGLDCAFLFGGFHIVSEFVDAPTGQAAILMSMPENRGKTTWELGLFVPANQMVGVCATVSGYAGDFSPHCHYQAAIVPGWRIREWIRTMRENPSDLVRPINELIRLRNSDWGDYWSAIYRRSIDPVLLLFPDITARSLDNLAYGWKNHEWPENWGHLRDILAPTAYWDDSTTAEYIIGIQSEGVIEQRNGEACLIRDKDVPGCYCYPPNRNYYNSDNPQHSRRKVMETQRAIEAPIRAYVCAKLGICGGGSTPPMD